MSDKFVFNVYLPSIKDYITVSELTNREYINILKFNRNKDTKGLSKYLEWMISEKTDTDVNLHRIDKFCVLLTLVMVNVSHSITLIGKCEETGQDYEVVVDVADVLNLVTNIEYTQHDITSDDIKITMKYPTSLFVDDVVIQNLITDITVNDTHCHTDQLTADQFNQVIGSLPGKMFKTIVNNIRDIKDKHSDIVLLDVFSPYIDNPTHSKLSIDLMGNSLFDFICTLFGHDLNGFYEMQFAMMNNYKFPPEYYMSITPTEVKTFYGYMKSDVEKKNQHIEQMKNSKKSPSERITG